MDEVTVREGVMKGKTLGEKWVYLVFREYLGTQIENLYNLYHIL